MEQLKIRRQAAGLSLRELAAKAGLSTAFVWKAETGKVSPSARSLQKLAKALGCAVSELIEPASPGVHPHTDKIVVELVQAVESGEKSASEAIDVLVGLGVVERVPRETTTGGAV